MIKFYKTEGEEGQYIVWDKEKDDYAFYFNKYGIFDYAEDVEHLLDEEVELEEFMAAFNQSTRPENLDEARKALIEVII